MPESYISIQDIETLPKLNKNNKYILIIILNILILGLYFLWYTYSFTYSRKKFTIFFVGGCIFIFFLDDYFKYKSSESAQGRIRGISSLLLGILMLFGSLYFHIMYSNIVARPVLSYYWYEYILAGGIIFAIVEATRRTFGSILAGTIYLIILYGLFGDIIPGALGHRGLTFPRFIEVSSLTFTGIWGNLTTIGVTWVTIFILFAGIVEGYGGMDMFAMVAIRISGKFRSGLAQSAVFMSWFMGMITGSTAANTSATGSFTIPLMKDAGLDAENAAAIESVASSGGQIMPPVMGAAAFLMAEILGIPYVDIILYALIPALLFYFSLALITAIIATNQGVTPPSKSTRLTELEFVTNSTKGYELVISITVLVYTLVILRYGPLTSGLYAIISLILSRFSISLLLSYQSSIRFSEDVINIIKQTIFGFIVGLRTVVPLAAVIAAISLTITLVTQTGINQTISLFLLDFGTSLPLLLTFTAILAILFGMGMPTVAAYTLVAILVAPSLTEFGIGEIPAHLFVLYFGILSGITPPIAVVVAIASGIANSNFIRTCIKALQIALPAYILPFAFIVNPELIFWDYTTVIITLFVFIGINAITIGVLGYISKSIPFPIRITLLITGFILIASSSVLLKFIMSSIPIVSFLYYSHYQLLPSTLQCTPD